MTRWSLSSIWAHCYVLLPFSHLWTLPCQTHTGTKSIRVICSRIGKFLWCSHLCIASRPDLCYFQGGFIHQLFQNTRWRIIRFLSACHLNQEVGYNKSNFHVGQDWTILPSAIHWSQVKEVRKHVAAVGSGIEVIYRIPVIHTTKQRLVQWDIEIISKFTNFF